MTKETRAITALRTHLHAPTLRSTMERALGVDAATYAQESTAALTPAQDAALRVIRVLFEEARNA